MKKFKVNGIDVEYLDDVPGLKFGLDFWVKRMPAGSKKLEAVWEIQTFVVDRKTGRLKKTWTWKFKVTIERSDSSNNSLFDNTTTKVEILEKPKQLKEGDKRTDEFKDIVEPVLKEYLKPDNK